MLLSSTAAEASSFVIVTPPKHSLGKSFVVLGAPMGKAAAAPKPAAAILAALPMPADPGTSPRIRQISRSLVALGMPAPAVTPEQVAAIGTARAAPRELRLPMVIRGGIVDDAWVAAVQPAVPASQSRSQRFAVSGKTPAAGPSPTVARDNASAARRSDTPAPPAPERPAAPPPSSMPTLRGQD